MAGSCGSLAAKFISGACQRYVRYQSRFSQHVSLFSTQSQNAELPEPPKRPLGSFMIFLNENREQIKVLNPGLGVRDLAKKLGGLYRDLSENEKEVYKQQAKKAAELYKERVKHFDESLDPVTKDAMKKKQLDDKKRKQKLRNRKLAKTLDKPKSGPHSGYTCFLASKRGQRGSLSIPEFAKQQASLWRFMPDYEKKVYEDRAKMNRADHQEAILEWEDKMLEAGQYKLIRASHIPKELLPKPKRTKKKKISASKRKTTEKGAKKTSTRRKKLSNKSDSSDSSDSDSSSNSAAVDEDVSWMRRE